MLMIVLSFHNHQANTQILCSSFDLTAAAVGSDSVRE
jgi:hypothetical protein